MEATIALLAYLVHLAMMPIYFFRKISFKVNIILSILADMRFVSVDANFWSPFFHRFVGVDPSTGLVTHYFWALKLGNKLYGIEAGEQYLDYYPIYFLSKKEYTFHRKIPVRNFFTIKR